MPQGHLGHLALGSWGSQLRGWQERVLLQKVQALPQVQVEEAQQQLEQLPVLLAGQVLLQGQVESERLEWVGVH